MVISDKDRNEAEALALRAGAPINGDASPFMWSLPLLRSLLDRVEELERRVQQMNSRQYRE